MGIISSQSIIILFIVVAVSSAFRVVIKLQKPSRAIYRDDDDGAPWSVYDSTVSGKDFPLSIQKLLDDCTQEEKSFVDCSEEFAQYFVRNITDAEAEEIVDRKTVPDSITILMREKLGICGGYTLYITHPMDEEGNMVHKTGGYENLKALFVSDSASDKF